MRIVRITSDTSIGLLGGQSGLQLKRLAAEGVDRALGKLLESGARRESQIGMVSGHLRRFMEQYPQLVQAGSTVAVTIEMPVQEGGTFARLTRGIGALGAVRPSRELRIGGDELPSAHPRRVRCMRRSSGVVRQAPRARQQPVAMPRV